MNGVHDVSKLRARCGDAEATVNLPDGWRVMTTDTEDGDADALALPRGLTAFEGDGFVPTILVRLVDKPPYAVPEEAGHVLADTGDVDVGESVIRRTAVVRGLVGSGQPILQMVVSNRVGPYQSIVVASATSAQWSAVADDFDSLAVSASLRVGAQEASS